MPMIGARFYAQIDNAHARGDLLENDLAKVNRNNPFELRCLFMRGYRNLIVVDYFD